MHLRPAQRIERHLLARHDSVSGDPLRLQAESRRAVDGEDVQLLERVAVDQARDALARGQLVLGVLAVERFRVAVARLVLALPEQVQRVDAVFWFWLVRHQVRTFALTSSDALPGPRRGTSRRSSPLP